MIHLNFAPFLLSIKRPPSLRQRKGLTTSSRSCDQSLMAIITGETRFQTMFALALIAHAQRNVTYLNASVVRVAGDRTGSVWDDSGQPLALHRPSKSAARCRADLCPLLSGIGICANYDGEVEW